MAEVKLVLNLVLNGLSLKSYVELNDMVEEFSFKPCFKWSILKIFSFRELHVVSLVLNLVLNGLSLKSFDGNRWIKTTTLVVLNLVLNGLSLKLNVNEVKVVLGEISFKPCFKWSILKINNILIGVIYMRKLEKVLNLVLNGLSLKWISTKQHTHYLWLVLNLVLNGLSLK